MMTAPRLGNICFPFSFSPETMHICLEAYVVFSVLFLVGLGVGLYFMLKPGTKIKTLPKSVKILSSSEKNAPKIILNNVKPEIHNDLSVNGNDINTNVSNSKKSNDGVKDVLNNMTPAPNGESPTQQEIDQMKRDAEATALALKNIAVANAKSNFANLKLNVNSVNDELTNLNSLETSINRYIRNNFLIN